MSGKTFQADKTSRKFKLSNTALYLFSALVIALSLLQLSTNIRLSNESKDATAAATFFAESVEQMCDIDPVKANNYQGLCSEAKEYASGLDSIYDLSRNPREVKSIDCTDSGSIIHFKDGTRVASDRMCGEATLVVPSP